MSPQHRPRWQNAMSTCRLLFLPRANLPADSYASQFELKFRLPCFIHSFVKSIASSFEDHGLTEIFGICSLVIDGAPTIFQSQPSTLHYLLLQNTDSHKDLLDFASSLKLRADC